MAADQNQKIQYHNDKSGYRTSTSVGGAATGQGANFVVADDAVSAGEAVSDTMRIAANDWWDQTMQSRLNNPAVDMFVIMMQRLHEKDLTGHVLDGSRGKYKSICFPAEDSPLVSPPELRKKYVNGLMFPARLSSDVLESYKIRMGQYAYAGQFRQAPAPPGGGLFKRQNWKFWKPAEMQLPAPELRVGDKVFTADVVDLPATMDDTVSSWDMTFKDNKESDHVVGQMWGAKGVDNYLLDQYREQADFAQSIAALLDLNAKYPMVNGTLVEDKANGPAIISTIKNRVPGLIPITPKGSKFARAQPLAYKQRAGNIYLPHPAIAPYIEGFMMRFESFPNIDEDDEIDAASQAINQMSATKKVWSDYHGETFTDAQAKPDFRKLDSDTSLHLSQWLTKDMKSHLVIALWSRKQHRLVILGEHITPDGARPEVVVSQVTALLKVVTGDVVYKLSDPRIEWIGNSLMFGTPGETDLRQIYAKYKLYPQVNNHYNETGSIAALSRLLFMSRPEVHFPNKSLLVHARCKELSRQMSAWYIDGNKSSADFPMCQALCSLVSILSESGRMVRELDAVKEYSPSRQQYKDLIQQFISAGDFVAADRVATRGGRVPPGAESNSSSSWMV
jgi:predicted phage terminase large subunit-like protein